MTTRSDAAGTVAVPRDTPRARAAIRWAADRRPDAALVVLNTRHPARFPSALDDGRIGDDEWSRWLRDARERTLALVTDALDRDQRRRTDVRCWTAAGRRPELIARATTEHDVDRLVIGARHRGRCSRFLLGRSVERTVRRASCPVTVID